MQNPGDAARRLLIEKEKAKQLAVINEFKKIRDRLYSDVADLLKRISDIQTTQGNAPPNLLIQKARLNELLNQVNDEIRRSSARLGIIVEQSQTSAINIAKANAGRNAELHSNLAFFDSDAVRELIGIAGDGEPLDVLFRGIAPHVKNQVFNALFYGLATGKPNAAIAKEINDAVGSGAFRAMTIVRTETNRAYREATRKFYENTDGVAGWRWIAALDLRTCPICWALHGQVFPNQEKFATHPNCRCTMIPVFDLNEPFETGPEAFAKLNRTQQNAILGPARLKLYELGAELKDFVEKTKTPFGPGRALHPLVNIEFDRNPRTPRPGPFPGSGRSGPGSPPPSGASATPKPTLSAAAKIQDFNPGEPLPEFVSNQDAEQYMRRRYPDTNFDFSKMDFKTVQPTANEIARLFDEYPEVAARMKYVGTYGNKNVAGGVRRSFPSGEYAHATHPDVGPNYIGLNPSWYSDEKKLKDSLERMHVIGWIADSKIENVFTHEFGHAIDGYLTRTIGRDTIVEVGYADGKNISVEGIKNAILRKWNPKRGEISDYAMTNKFERFAEGFSQSQSADPAHRSDLANRLEQFIRFTQQNRTFTKSEQKDWFAMTDAEQRAIRQRINDIYSELGLTKPFKKSEL